MKKLFLLIVLFPFLIFAQPKMFDKPLSSRIANYTIDCRLYPESKLVTGTEALNWKNTSSEEISELQFHLYQNAFRDENTTFMIEIGGVPGFLKGNWGYCEIKKIQLKDGTNILGTLEYLNPDDDNKNDRTVCSVRLPKPLNPGEIIDIFIEFETKLPPAVSRSGYEKDFFSVTQWFPKIAVFEDGKWNCHQYHSHGEFYSEFGIYDVKITIPEKFTVGATGILIKNEKAGKGLKKLHFYCEDVHDFAWCADTDFVEFKESYKGKVIRFLCQKDHVDIAERFLKSVKVVFDYYGTRFGEYPYPQITVIDSKHRATGEMEYPTLFQTGNFDTYYSIGKYRAEPVPESDKFIECLTIHEFGHNWWMGMIANNETDDVWIDEGINSYSTTVAFEYGIGKNILENHNGITKTIRDRERNYYLSMPKAATVLQPSWLYRPGAEFFTFNYTKPEMMLLTLHNYFGDEIWGNVMKTFFRRWKFKHPKTQDFYDVVYEITGKDLKRFFDQYMNTTHTIDFKINKVENNKVLIEKEGYLRFPVSVEFTFSDGTKESKEWDNKFSRTIFDFTGKPEITSVSIDPENIIEFELDKNNNKWIKK